MLGGAGVPLHWFGFGGDANRATATTMDEPVIKMLTQLQNVNVSFLETVLRYVVDQLVAAGTLPDMVEEQDSDGQPVMDADGKVQMIRSRDAFDIEPPEMDTTDIAQVGNALQSISNALTNATSENWISTETAQNVFWSLLGHLGYEVDSAQEKRLLATAQQQQDAQPQTDPNTQRMLALAMAGQNGPQPNGSVNAPTS